jgi:hypothetical protein
VIRFNQKTKNTMKVENEETAWTIIAGVLVLTISTCVTVGTLISGAKAKSHQQKMAELGYEKVEIIGSTGLKWVPSKRKNEKEPD